MSETELPRGDRERIAREVLERTLSERQYDRIEEQFAEEVSALGEDATMPRDALRGEAEYLFEGMPDATYSVEQVWVDGDTAVVQFRTEGSSRTSSRCRWTSRT